MTLPGMVQRLFQHLFQRLIRSRWFWLVLLPVLIGGWLLQGGLLSGPDHTWQRIQSDAVWRVGLDPSFPPFEQLNESGEIVGFDVDLARAMAAAWGVEVEFIATGFDGLIDALLVERFDSVISALPYDPRLTQDVRYSIVYFQAGTRLAVPNQSGIQSVEELTDERIAVEWGSAGDAHLRRLQEASPSLTRLPFPTAQEALQALQNSEADAIILDGVTLRLAQGSGLSIRPAGPPLTSDPYVIALPLGASQLNEEINDLIETFRQDGTLRAIEEDWFGAATNESLEPSTLD